MRSRHICPKCGGKTFYTTAHIMQEWRVDEDGNFLDVSEGCIDVDSEPDDDNSWFCATCGEEGVIAGEEMLQ